MRHAGIGRLKLKQDWGQPEDTKALVPDMSDWVPMWTKRAVNSWKILLKRFQYTEPLDLLTCFACLLGDSAIDKHSTDGIRSVRHAITKERARVKARSSCHVEGVQEVIVHTVMATRGLNAPIG